MLNEADFNNIDWIYLVISVRALQAVIFIHLLVETLLFDCLFCNMPGYI